MSYKRIAEIRQGRIIDLEAHKYTHSVHNLIVVVLVIALVIAVVL